MAEPLGGELAQEPVGQALVELYALGSHGSDELGRARAPSPGKKGPHERGALLAPRALEAGLLGMGA